MRSTARSIVFLLGLAVLGSALWAQCNQSCPERRNISVNGNGVVTADADLAIVRVGYKLYGPDAKSAYAAASETSNAIMQALTTSGVQRTAIESTSQVLQHTQPYELQQYPISSGERAGRQFTVSQSWIIRVKPDDAGKALNTAVNAGANESGWIEWIVENPSALEAQASAKALSNARMIAEQMAQKSDVHLGHLVSVSENQGPSVFNGAINGFGGGMGMGSTVAGTIQVGNQQLAINSRRVEFKVYVYAVFSIE
jgi:uncharacterized protein YggE